VLFTKCYEDDQIKEYEMGGACSVHWGDDKSWRERDYSEDLGVGGRKILKCILGKEGLRVWIVFIL
jgi:hypothetical protein